MIRSNGPSLSPWPKKSNRNVPMPCGGSKAVKAWLVLLFLLERKPWQSTAMRSVFSSGVARIPATLCPAGSVNVSASSILPF